MDPSIEDFNQRKGPIKGYAIPYLASKLLEY